MYKTLPRLGVQFCSALRKCGFYVSRLLPSFAGGWRQGLENLDEGLFSKSPCRKRHKSQTSEQSIGTQSCMGGEDSWGLTVMGLGQEQRVLRKPPRDGQPRPRSLRSRCGNVSGWPRSPRQDFPGGPVTKAMHPQCTGLGSAPALPWDWGSQTDQNKHFSFNKKSRCRDFLELKTAEGGSLLHLTAKSPLLKGRWKDLNLFTPQVISDLCFHLCHCTQLQSWSAQPAAPNLSGNQG